MESALLQPVLEFLGKSAPFDRLNASGCSLVARAIEVEYFRRGVEIQKLGEGAPYFYLVRSGAVSELDGDGQLLARHAEGQCLNADTVLADRHGRTRLVSHEDCLLYGIGAERFRQLCTELEVLGESFVSSLGNRLQRASIASEASLSSLGGTGAQVSSLLSRKLVAVDAQMPIAAVAKVMTKQAVSCVLVTGAAQLGIVTDRDFRRRVVATGKSLQDRVHSVMSSPVRTIEASAPFFEALLAMLEAEVHHLAVLEKGQPVGVVTTTDLLRLETENPVYLLNELNKQATRAGLVQVVNSRRDRVLERLVASGARPMDIHRVLTLVGDAVTRRLIELAERQLPEQQLGVLPAYCWVALGSQARNEMTLGSDQDNALILGANTSPDDPAMRWLAQTVCDGLDECGYPRCRGDIMACVPAWRQPIPAWQAHFERWIRQPETKATMQASIFFDMRSVMGEEALMSSLLTSVVGKARQQSIFLAHLAHDAMSRRPPLGLFRQFVLEKGGEHRDTLDLKHRGLVPVVDLARFFALEAGYTGPGTLKRLQAAADAGKVSREGLSELQAAFEWIATLRLQHQARCLRSGRMPDSFVAPDELSSTERRHLHDAFGVVRSMQNAVHVSRQLGALG